MRRIMILALTLALGTPRLRIAAAQDNVQLQAELALWDAIKDTKDPALFDDYLRKYPDGTFALVARTRLAELRGRPATDIPTPVRRAPPTTRPGEIRQNAKDGLKYAWIPPGEFEIGCDPRRDSELLIAAHSSY